LRVDRGIKGTSSKSRSTKRKKGRMLKTSKKIATKRPIYIPPTKNIESTLSLLDDRDEIESIGSTETRTVSNASGRSTPSIRSLIHEEKESDEGLPGKGGLDYTANNDVCCDWADPLESLQEYASKLSIS